jgi:cell division protein FtsW
MSNWAQINNRPSDSRRNKLAAAEIKSTLFDTAGDLKLTRKHRPDYLMVVLMIVLSFIGVVILFSITPALTGGDNDASTKFMLKQGMFLVAGLVSFFVASRVPLDFWRRHGSKFFVVALIICFMVPIMGALKIPPAYCTLGACRWISLGGLGTFQPAEFLKFGTVLFTAGFLAIRCARGELNSYRKTLLPLGVVTLASLFVLAIMQKDLGTSISLAAIVLVQLIVAGLETRKLMAILGAGAGLAVLSIIVAPHRMARIATFFGQGDATADYHINQAMIALGSGGLTGRGLGQSVQAFGWLPEAIHDSIFAVLGESLGFLGLLVIIALFGLLLRQIISKVDYIENIYLRLIVAGVFSWIAAHVVLNIGAMTHLIPLTGITLPLVSIGGTSMLFIMASLGLVFAISHYTMHRKVKAEGSSEDANPVSGRRFGRSRYADRSRLR